MSQETLPALVQTAVAIPESVMSRYAVKKQITRTVLQQVDGVPFCVEFESVAKEQPPVQNPKWDSPFVACDVVNLETGELNLLCMNKVLFSELDRAFPDGGYVGRKFAIVRAKAKDTDKRYRTYRILELEQVDRVIKSAGKPVIDGESPEAVQHAKKHKDAKSA
jgi:hypothetical protein